MRERAPQAEAVEPGKRAALLLRWLPRLIVVAVVAYAIWFVGLYLLQDKILFPGALRTDEAVKRGDPPDPATRALWIDTSDGARVQAWFQPGAGRSATSPGPAVMYFHGNGDLLQTRWSAVRNYLDAGISALAMEYRGYGTSTGSPSRAGILNDAIAFHEKLVAMPEVDPNRMILAGLSLGGAFAIVLAEKRPPAALVLECTFATSDDMAARYWVPGALCRDRFDSCAVLSRLDVPALIFHGRTDLTIPFWQGQKLASAARRGRLVPLACGHDDFRSDWLTTRAFLVEHKLIPP